VTPRQRLAQQLSEHEGFRRYVYDDANGKPIVPGSTVVGHPTVGYGLALDTHGLLERHAALVREELLDERQHALSLRLHGWSELDDVRQMALLELSYQLGVDGLLDFRRMLRHLDAGDYAEARTELLTSKWATQTGEARKAALGHMLETGQWPKG
jgi:lysozyme